MDQRELAFGTHTHTHTTRQFNNNIIITRCYVRADDVHVQKFKRAAAASENEISFSYTLVYKNILILQICSKKKKKKDFF